MSAGEDHLEAMFRKAMHVQMIEAAFPAVVQPPEVEAYRRQCCSELRSFIATEVVGMSPSDFESWRCEAYPSKNTCSNCSGHGFTTSNREDWRSIKFCEECPRGRRMIAERDSFTGGTDADR